MLRTLFIAAPVLVACALGATASAHPRLLTTEPAAGAVVTNSPKEVRMEFSEDLVLKFSGVEVKDERGQKVAIGAPVVDAANKKRLVMPLPTPLPAGVYSVAWHAVASDTHRIKGSYTFTVEPK
jgi:methionine-rich copper-binding protein CopC